MSTVTAIKATECGHVLAFSAHPVQIARLKTDHDFLLHLGDTRFELAEIDDGDATAAFFDGLNCDRCVIKVAGVTR